MSPDAGETMVWRALKDGNPAPQGHRVASHQASRHRLWLGDNIGTCINRGAGLAERIGGARLNPVHSCYGAAGLRTSSSIVHDCRNLDVEKRAAAEDTSPNHPIRHRSDSMPLSLRFCGLALASLAGPALLSLPVLQSAAQELDSFAVLAGSAVTDAGSSVITGNVGVSPGSSITGFPPAIVNAPYTIYNDDAVAAAAQSQLTTAYNILAARPSTSD